MRASGEVDWPGGRSSFGAVTEPREQARVRSAYEWLRKRTRGAGALRAAPRADHGADEHGRNRTRSAGGGGHALHAAEQPHTHPAEGAALEGVEEAEEAEREEEGEG